jgi:hypothetical protein
MASFNWHPSSDDPPKNYPLPPGLRTQMPSIHLPQSGTLNQPDQNTFEFASRQFPPNQEYLNNSYTYNRPYNVPPSIQTGNVANQTYYQPGSAIVEAQASPMFPDINNISPFAKLASPNRHSSSSQPVAREIPTTVVISKQTSMLSIYYFNLFEI